MKLNYLEFLLVNNFIRAYVQEKYELPLLMNMVASNAFDSVLEIGCGNGNGTKLIRKYFNPRHITAIDLDEKMIQIAQETVSDESTIFQVMDASKLDFPNESFDAIFDFSSIHHIPNWKSCIEELKRVLKVGGKLILEEFSIDTFSGFPGRLYRLLLSHPYEHMFSTDEIVRYIEDVGFQIDDIKMLNPLKMMPHFFLLAGVPDIEIDYES
ncbi:MAG: methyltransferase domain-containing protein [Desulfobacterales bacterium]|jgi:ubiquinone/menaquinone biosynthesis C-methylase UbiE